MHVTDCDATLKTESPVLWHKTSQASNQPVSESVRIADPADMASTFCNSYCLQGDNVQLAEVEALIQEFDLDGSGEVDVTEFMYVLALQRRTEYTAAQVMRCVSKKSSCQPL